ncbi:MAG: hypothetical protein RIN56_18545 [Sporomusaceae bacterium]|nr:hypothetical protein [Sporomusaceae bacterium]
MRPKYAALFIVWLLLLSTAVCQAEERKDEWKKSGFNFRGIKTVLLATSADPRAEMDEFHIRRLENVYTNVFIEDRAKWVNSSFNFITLNKLKDMISKAIGEDLRRLETEDPARYKAEIARFTPLITDAVLHIKVSSFGYDKRFVPEKISTYIEQVEVETDVYIQDSKGNWIQQKRKVKKPVERTSITPAHYDTYGNAGMKYMLIDNKTNESVWMLLDVREANGKDPIDMTERIINRAAECLAKI